MNAKDKKDKAFNKIIQFSVDTLDVDLENNVTHKDNQLLGNKYKYDFLSIQGFMVLIYLLKLIDKIFL